MRPAGKGLKTLDVNETAEGAVRAHTHAWVRRKNFQKI
ncbi:MAG: hypothetical protein ACJAVS_000673 [Paracoccaceae bacterium]|jgi:hypothetical protein